MRSTMQQRSGVSRRAERSALTLVAVFALAIALIQSAQAQIYNVLYTFSGGADGATPYASLVRDAAGNLYGVAAQGGSPA
jgi:hypothetical protein